MVIELIQRRAVAKQGGSGRAGRVGRVVNANLALAAFQRLTHRREIVEIAAGILNLAPA